MTTTTKLGDYLGRALKNYNPGTSNATDFLGRNVIASDKDSLGRALINTPLHPPPDWVGSTAYSTVGTRRRLPDTPEVQTVTITGTPTGGNFTLTYNGQTTANIAYNAAAAAVLSALVALSNIDPGDVTVGGGPGPGTPYTVTFQNEFGNVNQMTAAHTFTGGTTPNVAVTTTTPGVSRGQILEVTVGGTSNSTAPTAPAVGATVVDNTVTWRRLA